MSGKSAGVALVAVSLALVACQAGPEQRERTLARVARADSIIAHGPVVRDLRSPAESTRIIYTRPTPLALPAAAAAGAGQPGAPPGSSKPDTTRAAPSRTAPPPAPRAAPRPPGAH